VVVETGGSVDGGGCVVGGGGGPATSFSVSGATPAGGVQRNSNGMAPAVEVAVVETGAIMTGVPVPDRVNVKSAGADWKEMSTAGSVGAGRLIVVGPGSVAEGEPVAPPVAVMFNVESVWTRLVFPVA
jgi:hypothetical protein